MKNKQSTTKWVRARAKPFIPWIIFISILNIIASLSYVLLAKLSQHILDTSINTAIHTFVLASVLLFGLILFHIVVEAAVSIIATKIATKMNIELKNYMFTNLMKKRYNNIAQYHSGDLLNRFSSDVDVIVNGSIMLIPSIVSMLTKIIAGIAAICLQNYYFAFAVLIVGFTFPLCGRLLSRKYKNIHKEVQKTEGETRSFLQESFANIVVVKTFAGEKPFLLKLNDLLQHNRKLRIKKSVFSVVISASLFLFFSFGYYGVLVWGSTQIAAELMSIGTLIYFLQLISMLRTPLQNISGVIPKYYSMLASAERLIELEELENEQPSEENDIIRFETINANNLSFAYTNEIVLKDNNFSISRGSITAITGRSGSGKSTLFKLLLGLFPATYGNLNFDNKITIDETTRRMFSYVPQGNMIISGTIRDNISLCDKSVNDDDIISAAKTAAIYDFISSLPDGLDTVVSERGQGLSEGQVQRIAIARALLFDAPIILLDEATSALDEATETQLLNNIKTLTDKTIIFITHRNTSLNVCDKILYLSNGTFTTK